MPTGFGKMFTGPSFVQGMPTALAPTRLKELGKKGGLMDAKDPRVTLVNPLGANHSTNPDQTNKPMTVVLTFLG